MVETIAPAVPAPLAYGSIISERVVRGSFAGLHRTPMECGGSTPLWISSLAATVGRTFTSVSFAIGRDVKQSQVQSGLQRPHSKGARSDLTSKHSH